MAKVTWLGDEDPSVQVITQYGHTFVKGEAVDVDDKDPNMGKFKNMGTVFSVGGKADVIESAEPVPADPEEGTEKAAAKAALRARGEEVKGNPSLETLRNRLAASAKAE